MYAALMVAVALVAPTRVFGPVPGLGLLFAVISLCAAFAVARSDGRFDRAVAVFVALSIAAWTLSVAGQLYQTYAPPSDELRILIDPLTMTVATAADVVLVLSALTMARGMRR